MSKPAPISKRTFAIENLGCAKNQVDAETMLAALEQHGWRYVASANDAEVVIVNSCAFVEDARKETVDVTLAVRSDHPGKRIILAGCFSERYGSSLLSMLPEVDGVFGNKAPMKIAEIMEDVVAGRRPVLVPERVETGALRTRRLSLPGSAFVKVSEGCNNRCSYCSIPNIRGPLSSRSIAEVITEVEELLGQGVREINLVAQDLASYGADRDPEPDGRGLLDLLQAILRRPGRFWLRMLYLHPDNFAPELLSLCRDDERLLPYFDIPFQHGSEELLRTMNRRGSAERYLELIQSVRAGLPDAVIRSTFLVGFPGETERDFRSLLEFQERAALDWLGAFLYSREEGTAAYRSGVWAEMRDRLNKPAARRRKSLIEMKQVPITEARLDRFLGRTLDVLIEENVEGRPMAIGRAYLQAPEVDGLVVVHGTDLVPGQMRSCRMIRRNGVDLEAEVSGGAR